MGFEFTFLICASIMSTSLISGFIFANKETSEEPEEEDDDPCKEKEKRARSTSITARFNLKIKG